MTGLERHLQPLLAFAKRFFDAHPLQAEAELAGYRQGQLGLARIKGVRRVVVGHELADQLAAGNQRNECERTDAFRRDDRLEGIRQVGAGDIVKVDGQRIACICSPWRMAVDGLAIAVRQPAPGDKAHRLRIIEQQDGGARAAERLGDRIEGGFVDIVHRRRAMQPLREIVERGLLGHVPDQSSLGALAVGDVAGDLRSADDPAVAIPDGRDRQGYVDQAAVLVLTYGLVVLDALAGADALQDSRLFIAMIDRE